MTQSQQHTNTEPAHYNPENGAYDGQLVHPDMAHQVAQERPELKPKIFDRLAWADGVVRARRYRGATAAVFHRMTVRGATAAGCFESVPAMARGLGISRSSVQRAIKTISKDGYMAIEERHRQTYLCRPVFTKGVSPCAGRVSPCDPGEGVTMLPKGKPSSSIKKLRERTPVLDVKQADLETETETEFFSLSEEEETETTGKRQLLQREISKSLTIDDCAAWVTTNMPPSPMSSFVDDMPKCHEKQWWMPWVGNPKLGFLETTKRATAVKVYMADIESWQRLRADLPAKILLKGELPHLAEVHDGKPRLKEKVFCETCKGLVFTCGTSRFWVTLACLNKGRDGSLRRHFSGLGGGCHKGGTSQA